MKTLTPLHDKVIGRMVDVMGQDRTTAGGLILSDNAGDEQFIRPRWFEVTHVGPEQKDVSVGEFVLMPHGRWGHGFSIDGSTREEDKLFHLDTETMMAVADEPVS